MAGAIDYFSYDNPFIKLKTFFSWRARKRMYHLFAQAMKIQAEDNVLDLGATPDTKLGDSNFFEKMYPYKENVVVASIEDCSELVKTYGLKAFVMNHSRQPLPFRDKEFDVLFCSAVLEHVGTRADQKFFLEECFRVARKVFITTPNRYFPLEMHTFIPFLHWLPWKTFQKIVMRLKGPFWADINNLNLLSEKECRNMVKDYNASVQHVRTLGMKSNIIIIGK